VTRNERSNDESVALVVDDDPAIRGLVRAVLEQSHVGAPQVREASNSLHGLDVLEGLWERDLAVVVVVDQHMEGLSGLDMAAVALARDPDVRIVLFSGHLTEDLRAAAARIGIAACVAKTDIGQLPEVVAELTGRTAGP
jgi:CheY-like chemotaxis protein